MGFSWQHSEQAILQHNNVQQAVDSMLSGMGMYSLEQAVNSIAGML